MEKEKVIKIAVATVATFVVTKVAKKVFTYFKEDIYKAIEPKDVEEKLEALEETING